MSKEDLKYQQTIEKIRALEPVLDHPEELTAQILERIGQLPHRRKPGKILVITTWFSGISAALLLGLFVYQATDLQTDIPVNTQREITTTAHSQPAIVKVHALQTQQQDLTASEKVKMVNAAVSNRLKELEQKRYIYTEVISIYPTKKNDYENK